MLPVAGFYHCWYIGTLVAAMLIMVVIGFNAAVHLIFKESRNILGKLIMLYSLSVMWQCLVLYVVIMMHSVITLNSVAMQWEQP